MESSSASRWQGRRQGRCSGWRRQVSLYWKRPVYLKVPGPLEFQSSSGSANLAEVRGNQQVREIQSPSHSVSPPSCASCCTLGVTGDTQRMALGRVRTHRCTLYIHVSACHCPWSSGTSGCRGDSELLLVAVAETPWVSCRRSLGLESRDLCPLLSASRVMGIWLHL